MKNFTATYNTSTMTGVKYSFKAESMDQAKQFSSWKFTKEALATMTIIED